MKKTCYCLLLICCLNTIIGYTQKKEEKQIEKKFTLGINAGGHYSYLGGDSGYKDFYDQNVISYLAGVNAEIRINKYWSFYTNLDYKEKSFKSDLVFASGNGPLHVRNELRYTYLELPLMAKYNVKNSFLYFTGGIYLAQLLSAKVFVDSDSSVQDIKDTTENLDNGIVLGTGFIFFENESETSNMSIEFRYSHSLTNFAKQTSGSSIMNAYSLQLNYNFTP